MNMKKIIIYSIFLIISPKVFCASEKHKEDSSQNTRSSLQQAIFDCNYNKIANLLSDGESPDAIQYMPDDLSKIYYTSLSLAVYNSDTLSVALFMTAHANPKIKTMTLNCHTPTDAFDCARNASLNRQLMLNLLNDRSKAYEYLESKNNLTTQSKKRFLKKFKK